MGGRGALTAALRTADRFRSVSAFSPIVAPTQCPWGEKALTGYLGEDREAWGAYDACALIAAGARLPDLLVDQGDADTFLAGQARKGGGEGKSGAVRGELGGCRTIKKKK